MFTGIVQLVATVIKVGIKPGMHTITIELPTDSIKLLQLGASVSIDGVCLTVSRIDDTQISFDVMHETLSRTTLESLTVGSNVNVERSLRFGDELGGHLLSGHIDTTAEILKVDTPKNNHTITFAVTPQWIKYIFPKGYIALNGASLTVVDVQKDQSTFSVSLIPETLRLTTFAAKKIGDTVNFEIERNTQTIVDTVNDFLRANISNRIDGKIVID